MTPPPSGRRLERAEELYPQASPRRHGTAHSPYIARPRHQKWVKGLSGKVIYEFTRDGKLLMTEKHGYLIGRIFLNKRISAARQKRRIIQTALPQLPPAKTMNVAAELQIKTLPIASLRP